jgi:hypothetical protein
VAEKEKGARDEEEELVQPGRMRGQLVLIPLVDQQLRILSFLKAL